MVDCPYSAVGLVVVHMHEVMWSSLVATSDRLAHLGLDYHIHIGNVLSSSARDAAYISQRRRVHSQKRVRARFDHSYKNMHLFHAAGETQRIMPMTLTSNIKSCIPNTRSIVV